MQILFNSYFGFVVSGYLPTESNITNTFVYGKFNNIGSKPVPNPALSLTWKIWQMNRLQKKFYHP